MIDYIKELIDEILSALIALIRLCFLSVTFFLSGVHIILFTRTEICNVEMRGMAWRCDREKMHDQLSFVDRVCLENPDLLDYADEQMRKDGELPPPDTDDSDGDYDI